MLVMRRKVGETIVIANRVRMTVLEVRGGVVKLGVEAPSEVSVFREEVFLQIQEENRAASESLPDPAAVLDALAHRDAPGDGDEDDGETASRGD